MILPTVGYVIVSAAVAGLYLAILGGAELAGSERSAAPRMCWRLESTLAPETVLPGVDP